MSGAVLALWLEFIAADMARWTEPEGRADGAQEECWRAGFEDEHACQDWIAEREQR